MGAEAETNAEMMNEQTNAEVTTNPGMTGNISVGNCESVLKLPNGINIVDITQTGYDQPLRIILPPAKRDQYWCTIHVNAPNSTITCTGSGLTLDTAILKEAANLAQQTATTIKVPIAAKGETQEFCVYAAPCLKDCVFIGPFTSRDEGRAQITSGAGEWICGKQSMTPETHENTKHTDGNPQPSTSCVRTTTVDSEHENTTKTERSARTRINVINKRTPATGEYKQPKRRWETDPDVEWTHHPSSRSKRKIERARAIQRRFKTSLKQATTPN